MKIKVEIEVPERCCDCDFIHFNYANDWIGIIGYCEIFNVQSETVQEVPSIPKCSQCKELCDKEEDNKNRKAGAA